MTTAYREREELYLNEFERKSYLQRLGTLALIASATGLVLSLVAVANLNADVEDLTKNKLPYIQSRLDAMQGTI